MNINKRIIEEWGIYYPEIKNNLDSQGWYNGGNDKVQRTFNGLEMTKSNYYQIPTPLLLVEKRVEEKIVETISEEALVEATSLEVEPIKSLSAKKTSSKAEKVVKV